VARTANILSRVYRNLRRHEIDTNSLIDQEIFDELVLGQDHIISEAFPDKIVKVTLIDGEGTYDLTTDPIESSSGSGEAPPIKINIASVKATKLPAGWSGGNLNDDFSSIIYMPKGFSIITNADFVRILNSNPGLTGRPNIATIIDSKLKIYPVPSEEEEGEQIELYTYLSSSAGIIDDLNEPEVSNMFDKALENYATAQFLSGDERTQFMNDFLADLKRLKPIQNRKHHNLSRPPLTGFL